MAGRLYAEGEAARRALVRGIDMVADLVGPTLGPRGRHVVLQRLDAPPLITNDGVTIARSLELLQDPLTNQGVQLVREVAATTDTFVGDGTTTAALLARAIARDAFGRVVAGAEPNALAQGIGDAVAEVVGWIEARSRPGADPETVARVAEVAARDAHIGHLVAEALRAVGAEGVIRLEDDPAYGIRLEVHEGMRFENGLVSPALATDATARETTFDEPYVLLAADRVCEVAQLAPVLELAARERRPLVVVADEVSGDALRLLVVNIRRRGLPVAAVKAPRFGVDRSAALEDLAVHTGGTVLGRGIGRAVERATAQDLGRARRVVVTADTTAILDGHGDPDAIGRRAREIEAAIAYEESEYEREKLRTRLACLTGAVAVVRIGLDSDTEQDETRHRIRDAIAAGRAAITGGIVPGGGAALAQAAAAVEVSGRDDRSAGRAVVRRALEAPLRQLATNAALDPSVAVRDVTAAPFGHGLDIRRRELCDLVERGVFDPAKVVCSTLEIAASIARTALRSDAIIAQPPLRIPRRPHHPHGHHHHGDPEGHTHASGHAHGHHVHTHDHAHGGHDHSPAAQDEREPAPA